MINKVLSTCPIDPKISFYPFSLTLDTVYDMKIRLIVFFSKIVHFGHYLSNISDKNGHILTKICPFVEYTLVNVVCKFH